MVESHRIAICLRDSELRVFVSIRAIAMGRLVGVDFGYVRLSH
jgi:hypothetical protein